MKTSSKILLALAATAAFSLVHPASANLAANGDPPSPGLSESNKTSRLEYHDEWRKLWEDHITWTRVVILGILHDLPGAPAYTDRLLQNAQDMEAALTPYYRQDAEQLGGLIRDHLVIAAQILQAIHDGQPTEDLIARWYANGNDIAVKMNEMNPQFWPLDEAQRMWREHLDATIAEVIAHHNGDFGAEVAAYDLVHSLALEMADFFSNGVMQQFPNRFKGKIS